MPNPYLRFALLALVILSSSPPVMAQHYIRRMWQADFGAPALTDWSVSQWTGGKLVTVGNTLLETGQTGILTTVQDAGGDILWSQVFLHPGSMAGHSYGLCMTIDADGNIYTSGASRFSFFDDFDMVVVKYDSTGQELWYTLLGDTGDDAATALALVPGDTLLYLAGGSAAVNDTSDYLTLQLSTNSGDVLWHKRYDYASLEDVPIGLAADGYGNVVVTGASAAASGDWEIATLRYGKTSGTLLAERREGLPLSLDQPAGMVRDAQDNYYICGNMQPQGQASFIRVLKLDEELEPLWEADYWGDTLGCNARAMHLDEDGNVWAAGSCVEPSGRISPLIVRFDPSDGDLLGYRVWNFSDKPQAEIRHLARAAGGGMYLQGQTGPANGPGKVFLARTNNQGLPYWEHEIPGIARASGLQRADSLEVVAAIALHGPDSVRYQTRRYAEAWLEDLPVYNEDGDPLYAASHVIVRFNPDIMALAFVDDHEKQYGLLSEAVIQSTELALLIDTLLGAEETSANWHVYKIFPFLHSDKTTMTSRLGHEIRMPKLWSALLLAIPQEGVAVYDPAQASDSLATLPWEYIRYAHPNVFGTYADAPNDPLLQYQYHLWDTTAAGQYIDAHIRMDSVWAKYEWDTSRIVRAAVFDSGVRFTHEDFSCQPFCPDDPPGNGSVVYLNLDFKTTPGGASIPTGSGDPLDYGGGHGTSSAGLIGAVNNNGLGISGVAGGNYEQETIGVLLQNFRVSHGGQIVVSNSLAPAFIWAIGETAQADILNSSFGFQSGAEFKDDENLLREIYWLAYRANVIAVNSRDNDGNDEEWLPATFRDEWGMSVGASGDDGHIATFEVNCGPPPPVGNNTQFTSSFGKGLDVLAPGVNPLLEKTPSGLSDNGYQKFGGTSASAPQVAGLAAWVLNQSSNTLAVEDVERLIEYAAQDKTDNFYEEYPGYDDRSGWGLIDAGATLDLMHSSKVIRVRLTGAASEYITEMDGILCDSSWGCLVLLKWSDPDVNITPDTLLWARIYRYQAGFSINVCQLGDEAAFQTFADTAKTPYWVLNSLSFFYGEAVANPSEYLELEPWDNARFEDLVWDSCSLSGSLVGYKYEFLATEGVNIIDSITLPVPEEQDFHFSILVKKVSGLPDTLVLGNTINSTQEVVNPAYRKLVLWPNPFGDEIIVQLPKDVNQDGQLQVFDFQGRLLFQYTVTSFDPAQHTIPTNNWPPGAYFVRFVSPSFLLAAKAIKF